MVIYMKIYNQYQYSYPHKSNYYPIDAPRIEQALSKLTSADFYVHLPFCSTKCGYCNLFSTTGLESQIDYYLEAIKRQYQQFSQISTIVPNSLILGGGTPIILSIAQLDTLFTTLHIDPKNHYSAIELSPNEVTKEKLTYLKHVGFDRVSIGIQSFHEQELKFLNRHHKTKNCHKSLEEISKQDFTDFNIDLIYGMEGQTQQLLKESIDHALNYNPTEIFIYPLYIRKNTSLFGTVSLDEEHMYNLYQFLTHYLHTMGYNQTSMRRFTKKPMEPLSSCGFEPSLSFGCGGRSYLGNLHVCHPYSDSSSQVKATLNTFIKQEDFLKELVGYELNDKQLKHRFIVKNLLHLNGLKPQAYERIFSSTLYDDYKVFKEKGLDQYLVYDKDNISLKDFGCSDFIIDLMLDYEGAQHGHL